MTIIEKNARALRPHRSVRSAVRREVDDLIATRHWALATTLALLAAALLARAGG